MNILLHSNVHLWETHLAQMVELGLIHLNKNDKIYILFCNNELKGCPANFYNKKNICKRCVSQQKHTINNVLKNVTILNLDLNNKINFPNFKSVEEFKKINYNGLPVGKLTISTIVTQEADVYINFRDIKKDAFRIAENAINLFNFTLDIIKKNKIDIVYSWNGRRSSDGPPLYAAKKLGIKYFAYITGGQIQNFKTQPTLGIHNLNYTRKLIEKFYRKNKRSKNFYKMSKYFFKYMRYGGREISGRFIYSQLFDQKIVKISSKKKTLLIFTSSYWEFFSLHDNEWAKIDQFKILKKILNNKILKKKYDIIVRWHPNQRFAGSGEKKIINNIISKKEEITHYDFNSKINSYSLLENSDIILSFGSTIGIEATYYNKPSICFGSAFYDKTNGVYLAKNFQQLQKLLLKNLKPLSKQNALKFGFHEMMAGNITYKFLKFNKFGHWFYKDWIMAFQRYTCKRRKSITTLRLYDHNFLWAFRFTDYYDQHSSQ